MTRKAISIYMAATCAIVIVAPGRFVCGILIAAELLILMLFGLLFKSFIKKIKIEKMEQPVMLCFVIFATIFCKRLIALFMPEVALQLGFVLFLPSISTFTTVFLLEETDMSLKESLKKDMPAAVLFAAYILLVSLIRDIIGFGTITLPSSGHQLEFVLFSENRISSATFIATIPGSLILNALLLSAYLFVEKKMNIIKKAELPQIKNAGVEQ